MMNRQRITGIKRHLRIALCGALLMTLAACGFEPVYATRAADATGPKIEGVAVEDVGTNDPSYRHLAQLFRSSLEDRLNPGNLRNQPLPYRLKVDLVVSESAVAISRDGTVSRYNLNLDANLTLFRATDGAPLYRSHARRTSSYNNVTNAFFSTYISSQDATQRAANELAQDIGMRLAAFFTQHPNPQPVGPKPAAVPALAPPVAAPLRIMPER